MLIFDNFILYWLCFNSHFVCFLFFFSCSCLSLVAEKNVKEMTVKSMLILVSALPVDQINISRGQRDSGGFKYYQLRCVFVLYIGRRIVYLFVPVFGESNCGWQCVLLRFGKIFFEYHLLFFLIDFVLIAWNIQQFCVH